MRPPAEAPGWEVLELARQSAQAHATFQRLMTEAHLEYLRVTEAIVTGRPAAPTPGAATVPAQADRQGSQETAPEPELELELEPEPEPDRTDAGLIRLTPSWVETPLGGLALPGLSAGPVHVVDGGSGLAAVVAAELAGRGITAEVADAPGPAGVVFLGGLAAPATPADAIDIQLSALALARDGGKRGVFVTVADTGAGAAGPWLGGLSGLVGTVGRERAAVSVVSIDCERGDRGPAAVAGLIADELTRGSGSQRVRLAANGTRSVGRLVPAPAGPSRGPGVGPDSVVVVSGDPRGLCGAALVGLARATRCRLVVLGGTPLIAEPPGLTDARDESALLRKFAAGTGGPDGLAGMRARARSVLAVREIRATIDACSEAGAQVRYLCVDVRDADAVAGALEQVRAGWGPITGLVHAPTTARTPVEKSGGGLAVLLGAVADDPIETLMLFSSVAGWSGSAGEGERALADATLDRIAEAEQRRRSGCRVRSLAWGTYDGDTLIAEGIPVAAGAAAFVAELSVGGPAHVVLARRSAVPETPRPATVTVSAETHPWIDDHRPQDIPILPPAAGIGWMAAAARVHDREAVLTDIRVLRAVATDQPQTITVTTSGRGLSLSNGAGEPCLRAMFGAPGPDRQWRPTGDPARFPGSSVYAGRPLFHGPLLQVVRSLGEIGPDGVVGTVLGARAMGWPGDDLPVDLAALDGAMQLSAVWAMDEHRPVLPMGMAECRIHRWGRLPGPALCVVADGRRDDVGARCDAALVGPDGELWVELLGIEFVAQPAGAAPLSAPRPAPACSA